MAKKKKYRAILWARKIYDKGLEGYYTWELIIFAAPPPCHAVASIVPQLRYSSFKEAVKAGEYTAKTFDIEIDQRAYPSKRS